jgi:hypothetical protein
VNSGTEVPALDGGEGRAFVKRFRPSTKNHNCAPIIVIFA